MRCMKVVLPEPAMPMHTTATALSLLIVNGYNYREVIDIGTGESRF